MLLLRSKKPLIIEEFFVFFQLLFITLCKINFFLFYFLIDFYLDDMIQITFFIILRLYLFFNKDFKNNLTVFIRWFNQVSSHGLVIDLGILYNLTFFKIIFYRFMIQFLF